MTALEEVAELKQKAIEILLAERERIDEQLALLQENAPAKRRGRKPKVTGPEATEPPADRSYTNQSVEL